MLYPNCTRNHAITYTNYITVLLENTCMQKSRFADKTIVFSEHEVFKVVVMVTRNFLRIFLQMKNPLKMSFLITKFLIS
jgi:hypothetical protein